MQIETTVITTETTQVLGSNFQITTFEQSITAFCDCCDNNQTGTKTQLKNNGWHCGRNEQFCPECN